jgi:5'(3')-deoxyribonucleotidase
MDGVLSNYASSLRDFYPHLTMDEIKLWIMAPGTAPLGAKLTREQYMKDEVKIFLDAELYDGVHRGMKNLSMLFDRVTVVTLVNNQEAAEAKTEWLDLHKIPYDEILTRPITFDKGNLSAQLYIEDSPTQLMSCKIKPYCSDGHGMSIVMTSKQWTHGMN